MTPSEAGDPALLRHRLSQSSWPPSDACWVLFRCISSRMGPYREEQHRRQWVLCGCRCSRHRAGHADVADGVQLKMVLMLQRPEAECPDGVLAFPFVVNSSIYVLTGHSPNAHALRFQHAWPHTQRSQTANPEVPSTSTKPRLVPPPQPLLLLLCCHHASSTWKPRARVLATSRMACLPAAVALL